MDRVSGWEHAYIDRLVEWIRLQVSGAGVEGVVLSLSGGLDSAVVAGLCQRAGVPTLALFLPCHSDPFDEQCAVAVAERTGIQLKMVCLDNIFDQYLSVMDGTSWDRLTLMNIKARLRMLTVYAHANELNRLVIGTSNACERFVGYFTKHGDGAVDINPLGNLVKREVVALGLALSLPTEVIERPPTAGLWPGQTDEQEMGLTYEDIDTYLRGGVVAPDVAGRMQAMNRQSNHKRMPPAMPGFC